MSVVFGEYQLLKRIAGGGMGEVYLARRRGIRGFEKLTVVKTLLPNLVEDEGFIEMFRDEARLAALLNHPNVCQIFELGEVGGTWFIAMEYIRGENLRRVQAASIERGDLLPVPLLCRIAAEAAAGLHYAHELTDNEGAPLGLVHRDVSPHNIIVTIDGTVKLIDFGVAKAAGRSTQTSTGQLKGKVAYMSPEQASGYEIDRRTDVFALGIVLWEALTGERLFRGENDIDTLRNVVDCRVPPPSSVNPRVPRPLDAVVMRALTRDPEQRYPTAAAMRLALEEFLVESRLPGSTAHVAKLMEELFHDRIDGERRGGPLWDVDGDSLTGKSLPPGALRMDATGLQPVKRSRPYLVGGGIAFIATVAMGVGGLHYIGVLQTPTQKPVPAAKIALSIHSEPPGADVQLDGEDLGQTPIDSLPVKPREQGLLRLTAPDYVTIEKRLPLTTAGVRSFNLTRARVKVHIESTPPGAAVELSGALLGRTPFDWAEAESGRTYTLLFSLAKHANKSVEQIAREGATLSVTLLPDLPAAPAAPAAARPAAKPVAAPAIPEFD